LGNQPFFGIDNAVMAGSGPKIPPTGFKPLELTDLLSLYGKTPIHNLLDQNALTTFVEAWGSGGKVPLEVSKNSQLPFADKTGLALDAFIQSRQSGSDATLFLDKQLPIFERAKAMSETGEGPELRGLQDAIDRVRDNRSPEERQAADANGFKTVRGELIERFGPQEMWLGNRQIPKDPASLTADEVLGIARLLLSLTLTGEQGIWSILREGGLSVDARHELLAQLGGRAMELGSLLMRWVTEQAKELPNVERSPSADLAPLLDPKGAAAVVAQAYGDVAGHAAYLKSQVSEPFVKGIPDAALLALRDYADWASVAADVNGMLRGTETATPLLQAKAALIYAALLQFPTFEGVSFRVTNDAPGRYDQHQPGAIVEERGFLSSSDKLYELQDQFGREVLLVIHSKSARKLVPGILRDEREVIGLPGTHYQVLARDTALGLGGQPVTVIVMAEVAAP
jgi:hypothetical protein